MAGIYKIGFPDGTPIGDAKEQALAIVREDDADEVTAGPDVIQSAPDPNVVTAGTLAEAGRFLVRIVTGVPDPVVTAAAQRTAAAQAASADAVVGRLAMLPPDKLAALAALLDQVEG